MSEMPIVGNDADALHDWELNQELAALPTGGPPVNDLQLPEIGSLWIWELDKSHARELVQVVKHREDESGGWWVKTSGHWCSVHMHAPEYWNEVGRFYQACTPIVTLGERGANPAQAVVGPTPD